MGVTAVKVTLINPSDETRNMQTDMIVDTGSILTWLKGTKLSELGIRPRWKKEFRTIEGKLISRATGLAVIRYDGSEGAAEVVFGEDTDADVLGVTALEGLGYQVDPVSNQLRRSSLLAL